MDTAYWAKLNTDESSPLYNKATQQKTAPGSTFKPLMAVAGLSEGIITPTSTINCNGLFGEGLVNESDYVHCHQLSGHGDLNIVGAIQNSCNVFFCTLGYRLGLDENGTFTQKRSLEMIQKYADMFKLDEKTGIEISETDPNVTDSLPIPSSIGQVPTTIRRHSLHAMSQRLQIPVRFIIFPFCRKQRIRMAMTSIWAQISARR